MCFVSHIQFFNLVTLSKNICFSGIVDSDHNLKKGSTFSWLWFSIIFVFNCLEFGSDNEQIIHLLPSWIVFTFHFKFKGNQYELFSYCSAQNDSYVNPGCKGVASNVSVGGTAEYI